MKILLIRQGDTFKPLSEQDWEKTKRVKDGQIIEVDYKKPRNPLFHNKFMSMIRVVYNNQEQYDTIEGVLNVFKVQLGHCDTMMYRDMEIRIPRSISFGSMDELEFSEFYDRAVDFALSRFLPTVTRAELEEYASEIARYAG
jgi:hypothetical protein